MMIKGKKILVGGKAMVALGGSRLTSDTDYLVKVDSDVAFLYEKDANEIYLNANGNKFFKELYEMISKVKR